MARFGWHEFNSAELRRRLRSLEGFSLQRLMAVIEDARCWPKDEAKAGVRVVQLEPFPAAAVIEGQPLAESNRYVFTSQSIR